MLSLMRNATMLGFVAVVLTGGLVFTNAACGSDAQNHGATGQGADLGPDGGADAATTKGPGGDQSTDPNSDAGHGDAGSLSVDPPVPCGDTVCRAGAKCVASECTYDCTGTHVPGDYATVQEALTILGKTGGTLCLGPQLYDEAAGVRAADKPVTIIGVPGKTTVTVLGIESSYDTESSADVKVRGITGEMAVDGDNDFNVVFENCAFTVGAGDRHALEVRSRGEDATTSFNVTVRASSFGTTAGGDDFAGLFVSHAGPSKFTVDVDSSDFHLSQGTGITVSSTAYASNSPFRLTVRNSYIHDSTTGFAYVDPTGTKYGSPGPHADSIVLTNNTFVGNGTALSVGPIQTPEGGVTVQYFNNLFVNSTTVGVAFVDGNGDATLSHGNNLLFGNTNNYAGAALDGPGYLKVDPQLDTSARPPALKPGSPAHHAGDAAHAPDHDYWSHSRTGGIDLGAVQN
jgi:hypothetical protein